MLLDDAFYTAVGSKVAYPLFKSTVYINLLEYNKLKYRVSQNKQAQKIPTNKKLCKRVF